MTAPACRAFCEALVSEHRKFEKEADSCLPRFGQAAATANFLDSYATQARVLLQTRCSFEDLKPMLQTFVESTKASTYLWQAVVYANLCQLVRQARALLCSTEVK